MRAGVIYFDVYSSGGGGNPASSTAFRNVGHMLGDQDLKRIIHRNDDACEPEAGQEYRL
jgi:hypothetical protein